MDKKIFFSYKVKKDGTILHLFKGEERIGQISPEAIWVKEGNEFTEDQIAHITLYYSEKYGYSYEHHWNDFSESRKFISIQCPTCGKFH